MKKYQQRCTMAFVAGVLSLLSGNIFAAENVSGDVASQEHVRRQREAWLRRVMPRHIPNHPQEPAERDAGAENNNEAQLVVHQPMQPINEASFSQWLLNYRPSSGLAISAVVTSTALLALSVYTHWCKQKVKTASHELSSAEA